MSLEGIVDAGGVGERLVVRGERVMVVEKEEMSGR